MKQAVVLAAGEGRRLRPFTVHKPKAMLSIAGRPIIHYVIEALVQSGIRDIICVVGYEREQIISYIGDGSQYGASVSFVAQEKQLGTAHALLQAKNHVDKEFIVLHGNKVIDKETLNGIVEGEPFTIMARRVANPSRYGAITVQDGWLIGIEEKPKAPKSNLINEGIYLFDQSIFEYIDNYLDIPEVMLAVIGDKRKIRVIEGGGRWLDVVYPWDLLSFNDVILRDLNTTYGGIIEQGVNIRGKVRIGKNSIIRSGTNIVGPVVIGEGCEIGPGSCILPSTSVGSNVVISTLTEVKNSILEDDVHIGTGSIVQDSIIDKGTLAGPHFCAWSDEAEVKINGEYHTIRTGVMCGEGCRFAAGVTVAPGTIIGNNVRVHSLKFVSGMLPDNSLVV